MRALALILALAQLAGCASRAPGSAPVEDRRPASRAPAPAAKKAAPAPAPAAAPAPVADTYTVKRGDTLYSIALEHGQDYRDVAQWNSLEDPSKLSVGQVLRVTPPPQPPVAVGSSRFGSRIESRPLETPTRPVAAATPTPAAPAPPAREQPLLDAQPLSFAWPVKGKVVTGFAEPRQKGIDIQGKSGDAVIAAAAGRVTYVGSGIPGLGKLIVLKHDQGYITVYAHNKDILVKEQQAVKRGEKIAELGEKLHFQIRKGAAAVDPLLYLPRS